MALEKRTLTPEEKAAQKDRAKFRVFVVLVIFDILLVCYLVFEMISIFTKK